MTKKNRYQLLGGKMKKGKNKKQNKILILIIITAIILDQITKIIAFQKGWNIIPDEIDTSNNGYYIIMTIIVVLMIIRYITNDNTFIKLDTKIILGFAIAGAIGNLIDRIWNQNVIVFMRLGNDFHFNFAYIYIGIAWIGLAAILSKNVMKILKDKKNEKVIKDEYQKNKNTGSTSGKKN